MDHKRLVEAGYDKIAEQYLATKDPQDPATLAALARLAAGLPDGAPVLDLGCGAGVPVTAWLAARFAVTGVDISARQIALAREHVPGATFVQADMAALDFPAASFAAVVAFYAIIHVPREEQPGLVRQIYRWLRPGGRFLALWARTDWEGREPDWAGRGAPMWWSHFDGPANLAMLRAAGLAIGWAETITSAGETWLWVLAERPASRPVAPHS